MANEDNKPNEDPKPTVVTRITHKAVRAPRQPAPVQLTATLTRPKTTHPPARKPKMTAPRMMRAAAILPVIRQPLTTHQAHRRLARH